MTQVDTSRQNYRHGHTLSPHLGRVPALRLPRSLELFCALLESVQLPLCRVDAEAELLGAPLAGFKTCSVLLQQCSLGRAWASLRAR